MTYHPIADLLADVTARATGDREDVREAAAKLQASGEHAPILVALLNLVDVLSLAIDGQQGLRDALAAARDAGMQTAEEAAKTYRSVDSSTAPKGGVI